MSDIATLSGRLYLQISWSEGQVRRVNVDLQRPLTSLNRLWVGRQPAEVVHLLPLVFSACSLAQQLASVQALEAASGWQANFQVTHWRQQTVRLEALRESMFILKSFWHSAFPEEPLYLLLRSFQQTLHSLQPFMAFQAEAPHEQPKLPKDLVNFRRKIWPQWQKVARPVSDQWPDVALSPTTCASLKDEDLPHLLAQLRQDNAAPVVSGQPRTTGPAGSSQAGGVRQLLSERHHSLLGQVRCLLNELTEEPSREVEQAPLPQTDRGKGWSRVMTARGWLIHRVVLQQGRVAGYQLIAPTDWNLHSQGLLYQQLKKLLIDRERLRPLARDLVTSTCPCVEFQVDIEYA